jgi:hypothetical protein
MKKLTKKQTGGVLGFGTIGKQKNTLTQKEADAQKKKAAQFQKKVKNIIETAEKNKKKFNQDLKDGKIKLATVSKNKK